MKEIVERYKREVQAYLNGAKEPSVEVALPSAGPDLQEAYAMQRRRLLNRRLSLLVEESSMETEDVTEAFHDESRDIGYFQTNFKENKSYIYQNGKCSKLTRYVCREYYVRDNLGEPQKVNSVDTAWIIHSLYRRNTEFYSKERFDAKNSSEDSFVYFLIPFIGFLLSFFLSLFITIAISYFRIESSGKFFYLPVLLGLVGVVTSLILWKKQKDCRVASREVLSRIRDRFPDFSAEYFIGMVAGRLKCFCYAEEADELNAFSNIDLSDFGAAHRDVVNCDQIDFFFKDFMISDECFVIEAKVLLCLDRDVQNHVKQKKECITIQFVRPVGGIMSMDFYHDWYVAKVDV